MTIYYSLSKPIPTPDLLDGRLSSYGISVYPLPHNPNRYSVNDGMNAMFLDADPHDAFAITNMTRYAGHDVEFIIEALQKCFCVIIYSEYEPQYWDGAFPWDEPTDAEPDHENMTAAG